MKYRGPNSHPQTIGEFQRLDWLLYGGCHWCALGVHREFSMSEAIRLHGPNYSTSAYMLSLHCEKCGRKTGLCTRSPEERKADREAMHQVRSR